MLKVDMRPMVSVRQASEQIANWLGHPENKYMIFTDICKCLTDTDSQIIRIWLPEDEDVCAADYNIECRKFFELVKEATGLSWGDEFLADFE